MRISRYGLLEGGVVQRYLSNVRAGKQRWTMEEGMIGADGGVSGKNQHVKPVVFFILLIHLVATKIPSENINLF